ncbi:MAG: hypothetical protein LUP94_01615 [Candidatus Methanomethylicus sp.]|nr:hypothetical protein [Candidatus Methanomethylicus sp.]
MTIGFHYESFIHANPTQELLIAIVMFAYLMAIVFGTKYTYNIMKKRNFENGVAVYYNRKIIHIFGAGVLTLLFPVFFTAVTIPMILVGVIIVAIYLPHKLGKILYWFQVKENAYEVNFAIAWGLGIGLTWIFLGSPIYGVVTAAFMAFGDAVTGIVRNLVFKRRTKHWIGNVAMLFVCIPIGYIYAGNAGLVAAVVASIAEHFEFKPIDDNILITVSALITLILLNGA